MLHVLILSWLRRFTRASRTEHVNYSEYMCTSWVKDDSDYYFLFE